MSSPDEKVPMNFSVTQSLCCARATPTCLISFVSLAKPFAFVLLALAVLTFSSPGAAETLVGVFYSNGGWDMQDLHNLEAWQGKGYATVEFATGFCNSSEVMHNLFQRQLPNIWNNHNIPVITWKPTCGAAAADLDESIARGDYDSYLDSWANNLKVFLAGADGVFGSSDDRRVYIRLAHEMNGVWYPWSANSSGQTPAQYVAMWQHVHSIFDAKGIDASHLQWVWCVNNRDSGNYTAEDYFPGTGYVDWLGIDGYNWGDAQYGSMTFSWKTPGEIFGNMIGRLRKLGSKPIAFMEAASDPYFTSSGISVAEKNLWIPTLYSYARSMGVKMLIWFNEDPMTLGTACCSITDWRIFGGTDGDSSVTFSGTTYKTYSNYKSAVGIWWMKSSDPTNPRLLTDSEFAGIL
jgi:mannan endo-1,4-beta-mannosidase